MTGFVAQRVRSNTFAIIMLSTLFFAGLTTVCAHVSFRLWFTPVPITLQVLAVILSGLVLGGRLAAFCQVQYILAGLVGLPVFAGGGAGLNYLLGPTGGYILGFVPAAYVCGFLFEKIGKNSRVSAVIAGMAGVAVIYVLGSSWLGAWLCLFGRHGLSASLRSAWELGIMPFIAIDLIKALVASGLALGTSSIPGLAERFSLVQNHNLDR